MKLGITRYIDIEFVEMNDGKFIGYFKWADSNEAHRIAIFENELAIKNLKSATLTSLFHVYEFAYQKDGYIAIYANPEIEQMYEQEMELSEKVSEMLANNMEWLSEPPTGYKLYLLKTSNLHLIREDGTLIHSKVKVLANPEMHDIAKVKLAHNANEIVMDFENPLSLFGVDGKSYLGYKILADDEYKKFLKEGVNASEKYMKPYELTSSPS